MRLPPTPRRGFTLLEVLLAAAIATVLLGGLYVAMDVQLKAAKSGRDMVERTTLARSLLARLSNDIASHLPPVDPKNQQAGSGQAALAAQVDPSLAGTTGTAATGTSPAGAALGAAASINGPVRFNLGLQGDSTTLILFTSRVPRGLHAVGSQDTETTGSDLRRVSYWLDAPGSNDSRGLLRQEILLVTAEDALTAVPPDVPLDDPHTQLVAEEVRSLRFHYWDGSAWQDSWDGTLPGPDGQTPLGPPMAIQITLEVARPGRRDDERGVKVYQHVVTLEAANGAGQQITTDTTAP